MRADRHALSVRTFLALARGDGGPSAVRTLTAAQHSRNLLTLRELVDLCAETDHPHTDSVARAWRLLAGLRRAAPTAVRRILTYPSVSAWAAQTVAALDRRGTGPVDQVARPAMLAVVVAAAARYAGIPLTVSFPTPPGGAFPLPALGHVRVPPPPAGTMELTVTPDGLAVDGVPLRAGSTWWPLPRLHAGRLDLRLDDLWSLARSDAVPPVRPDEAARWRVALAPGWRLLATHHRQYAAELAAAISMVMPLPPDATALTGDAGAAAERTAPLISGTFPTGVGCIALSGTGAATTTAATLVHELAHNKLAALANLFPLVRPGGDGLLPAPWRAGPRPLPALVQGLYAHVCVAGFWRRQRHHESRPAGARRARAESGRLRAACREVADLLLADDRLTPYGRLLVEQLQAVSRAGAAGP